MGRNINDLTDEELDNLSADEIDGLEGADLSGDDAEGEEDEAGGTEGEEEDADAAAGEEEEEEAGDDESAEAEAARLAALAAEGDGNDMVPRSRLNEVLAERDDYKGMLQVALNNRGVAMPAATTETAEEVDPDPMPVVDIKAMNREYHQLVVDGEDEKAAALLDKIEDARTSLNEWNLRKVSREAEAAAASRITKHQTSQALAAVTETLHKAYPFLNNESKTADPDAILAVNAKAKALIAQGKSPAVALSEAGDSIGKKFAKLLGIKAPAKVEAKSDAVKQAGEQRSKDAIKRNLSVRQPDTIKSGVGIRDKAAKLDISKMTDEQLDKLSPEEMEEALGYNG